MTVDLSTLESGDTVHFRCGGSAVVESKELYKDNWFGVRFKDSKRMNITWNKQGNFYEGHSVPIDIIRIEKAVKIPEGFTRWNGGERPVDGEVEVEILLRGGSVRKAFAKVWGWYHGPGSPSESDIIAYRVITPQRAGEIWFVVYAIDDGQDHDVVIAHSQPAAIKLAKLYSDTETDILAITNKLTWKQGDGLELLK